MLLEVLFKHKRTLIVAALTKQKIELPFLRTKSKLKKRLAAQLADGSLDLNVIVAALVELEGWGRQQVYLYKWNGGTHLQNQWLDHGWVDSHIQKFDVYKLFNRARSISEQQDSTLFAINYPSDSKRIRFVWVQNRISSKRVKDDDPVSPPFAISSDGTRWERTVMRAHRETIVRDVTSFEWDIVAGEAMIMIRKSSGTRYKDVRDTTERELADLVPIEDFWPLTMSKLITNLGDVEGVVREKIRDRALSDEDVTITYETGHKKDVLSNASVQALRKSRAGDFTGYGGFSRWPVDNGTYVGIDLYAMKQNDHRIGIRSEQLEEDVRSVLQRIRANCE